MYDIIMVGAGGANLFAAEELAKKGKDILILDAGVDLKDKKCLIEEKGKCVSCKPCRIISGFGGAQFFEGTKLSIFPAGSGFIPFCGGVEETKGVYKEVDKKLQKYGKEKRDVVDSEKIVDLENKFNKEGINMKYYNAQKVSKKTMNKIAYGIKKDLLNSGVDIILGEQVVDVKRNSHGFKISTDKQKYLCKKVIFGVGRAGSRQLIKIADKIGIEYENEKQEIEIGVRVEMPYKVFNNIDNIHNDLKLKVKLNNQEQVRTFCQDYKGYITKCVYNLKGDKTISSLDGHIIGTDEEGGKMSDVANIAVHHRFTTDLSMDEIYSFINDMNIKDKPVVQSMKNFMNNTNEVNEFKNKFSMPDVLEGDINNILPSRTSKVLKEFINKIDNVIPGFANPTNTVYSPSFEMGWKKFKVDKNLETNIKGIYIVGDATGHFRGAMQAMGSGLVVAKGIK